MKKENFLKLFAKAKLNEQEIKYFLSDAENAIKNIDCDNEFDYYNLQETQYCLIKYAKHEWLEIAKSGMKKILDTIK